MSESATSQRKRSALERKSVNVVTAVIENARKQRVFFFLCFVFEKERAHAGEKERQSCEQSNREQIESKRTNSVRKRKCRERCYRA
jgi:hypothetical protein